MKKLIPVILLLILLVIQLFPISTENSPVIADQDLASFLPQGQESDLLPLIKASCYDCHSNNTTYPKYTRFQPVGWWTKGHVKGGRQKVNFSKWGSYTQKERIAKAQECAEVIEQKRMPMKSYTWLHADAKLDKEARAALVRLFENL